MATKTALRPRPVPVPALATEAVLQGRPVRAGVGDATRLRIRRSGSICAVVTAERHIGHGVNVGNNIWLAYDATNMNDEQNGFRFLGSFPDDEKALQAITASYLGFGRSGSSADFWARSSTVM
jgi:hypothetical protein